MEEEDYNILCNYCEESAYCQLYGYCLLEENKDKLKNNDGKKEKSNV